MTGLLREGPAARRLAAAACLLVLLVPSVLLGLRVARVSAHRVVYPYELSRMEGVFVRHARRVAAGEPLYAAPSAAWVPLLYTPLHHAAAGALLRAPLPVHDYLAVRLPSILGVAGALLVGMALVARAGGPRWLPLLTPLLAASAYPTVAGFYDQARPDNLMAGLLVASVAVLAVGGGAWHVAGFAALSVLAFLAKQSALVFTAIFLAGVALVDRRAAARAALATGLGVALVAGVGHLVTDGWFTTYVFGVAGHHGRKWKDLGEAIVQVYAGELALPSLAVLLALATLGLGGGPLRDRAARRARGPGRIRSVTLVAAVAAGAFSAASILQPLAMRNVFVLYALAGAVFVPVALGWALEAVPAGARDRLTAGAWVVLGVALLSGLRDLEPLHPWSLHERRAREVREALRPYGPPERIWVTLHGAFWDDPEAREYVFAGALYDLVGGYFGPERTGHQVPADLRAKIQARAFDAIVVAAWDDRLQDLIGAHYRLDPESPELRIPAFSGFPPSRELVWIPRETPAAPAEDGRGTR